MKMYYRAISVIFLGLLICTIAGCKNYQSATKNNKMQDSNDNSSPGEIETSNTNSIVKENSVYDCNLSEDKKNYNGKVDIVVGDNLYATQINDWYMYFNQYEGDIVEIEGYYIGDFQPYDFIGRYGPSCPYCQGGYVCFEFLTDEDLSGLESGKDWIKITGILREGTDSKKGPFDYIEVLKFEKMDKVGMDTVKN